MPSIPMDNPNHQFDFVSAGDVPDSHAWPALIVHDYPSSESDSIPLIDLCVDDRHLASQIGSACENWGAFQVTGHGIPLLSSLESEARRLFCLPTHRKLKAAKSPDSLTGYGLPPISPFFSKLMWYEGFTIFGSVAEHATKLWPDDCARFCEVIEEYKEEMRKLAERLMRLMLLSLGLTEEDIDWTAKELVGDVSAALQLNSYPACPDPDRAMGLARHTDSGLLTILYQSSAGRGLQVLRSGRWVPVTPVPGALVVNIGDLGHVLSNGRFHSVVHRAVVSRTHHRVSAAYICGPPAHVKVSPVGKSSLAYRSVTWQEYLALRAKLFDKALASIKVSEEDCNNNGNTSCISCV